MLRMATNDDPLVDQIAGNFGWKKYAVGCAFDRPTKGCLKQAMEHLRSEKLRQHSTLNATCSDRLLTPLKPHSHISMYKSAAASVSTHEKQLQVQKNPAKNCVFCLPGPGTAQMSSVFFVVSVPIHWHHAYTTASACLRGMERVPTREFS